MSFLDTNRSGNTSTETLKKNKDLEHTWRWKNRKKGRGESPDVLRFDERDLKIVEHFSGHNSRGCEKARSC